MEGRKMSFEIIREEFKVKSSTDHRRKVNRITIAIIRNGDEIRRRFEFGTDKTFDHMVERLRELDLSGDILR
jgi:hypothetical protein